MPGFPSRIVSRAAGRLWSRVTAATDLGCAATPILCYHSISDRPYAISPARFAAQMRWLRRHGYHSVGLDHAVAHDPANPQPSRGACPHPSRRVIITFDDGLADLETNALPALVETGMWAVIFFSPGLAGTSAWYAPEEGRLITERRPGAKRLDFMSWEQAERMAAAGMSFHSHGWSHPRMTDLDEAGIAGELLRSWQALEQRLGASGRFLSYPFGAFDRRVQRAVAALGCAGAVCTMPGFNGPRRDPYALRRIAPNPTDDLCAFAFKLSPAAGWWYRAAHRGAACRAHPPASAAGASEGG